jgi:hypothetical protein
MTMHPHAFAPLMSSKGEVAHCSGNHGVGSIDQIILKNVLTVDASKHHMVDACSAILPYLSGPGGDIPAMGREFFPDLGIPLGM